MALTSSAGPFYAKDSNGTLQKIKVVDVASDLIAGYSFVDATGSLHENLEKISAAIGRPSSLTVTKKIFSNENIALKNKLIDWSNTSSGSFRISCFDPDRESVTIYNDSSKDLFISIDNDLNPSIHIDFIDENDIKNINIKYKYTDGSNIETLFNYTIEDIKNIHSFHTFSGQPEEKYGYGKTYTIKNYSGYTRLNLFLTPDFYSQNLNKQLDVYTSTGSYEICLSSSADGITSDVLSVDLTSSADTAEYESLQYKIYTKLSGSSFIDTTFYTSSNTENTINGFYFDGISDPSEPTASPENYSYIVFRNETLLLTEKDATSCIFGYLIKPDPDELLSIRVTETS